MKRWVAAGSALAVGLFGLVAAPTTASAASCVPKREVLPTVVGPTAGDTAVYGLSDFATKAAVGSSNGLPVYWKNGVVKKVPLSAGYTTGRVTAVNHFGLMVGTVSGTTKAPRAFRYWAGQKAIQLYAKGTVATDVNNAGRAVGYDASAGYEYGPGVAVRRTLAMPAESEVSTVNGISDSGRIVGNGRFYDEETTYRYNTPVTWTSAADSVATAFGPVDFFDTYTGLSVAGIDNVGRAVGEESQSRLLNGSGAYWTSTKAARTLVGPPTLSGAALTAISQTNKISAGYVYGSPYDYPPGTMPADRAIVWRAGDYAKALPSLTSDRPSHALAADDDGRVAGYSVDKTGVQRPVVWNCAHRY